MNPIISPFSLGKDISYDVLSWNLHGTEPMSRPQSEAQAGALTWDPFHATGRLQITHNPPYQVMDGGNNASAVPIYQEFVEQAIAIKPSYISMIMPSRWYAGGRGLDKFREAMMQDIHIRKLYDFSDSKSIFALADISGGICYFLYDFNYDGPCEVYNIDGDSIDCESRYLNEFPIIVRSNKAISILHKVLAKGEKTVSETVSAMKPFGLRTYEQP